jgi:hypothetical protein
MGLAIAGKHAPAGEEQSEDHHVALLRLAAACGTGRGVA